MKKFYFLLIAIFALATTRAQVINFPDVNFKNKLLEASSQNQIAKNQMGIFINIDGNNDSEIDMEEALSVFYLDVSNFESSVSVKISNIEGLSNFINLKSFYCTANLLTQLDVTPLVNLEDFNCSENQITELDVSGVNNLVRLNCHSNQIPSLNISGMIELKILNCTNNQITSLDLSGKTHLRQLECRNNLLTNLDLSDLQSLEDFAANDNPYAALEFPLLPYLHTVQCMNSNITTLDLSQLPSLKTLLCGNNPLLATINIKNGSIETGYNFLNLPILEYICFDEAQTATIQNQIQFATGTPSCSLNTYCSFTPGGTFYTINGTAKYDFYSNGCDLNDPVYPNMKFAIQGTNGNGTLISNDQGEYIIPVVSGIHAISPILENPTFFNVTPSMATISFPGQNPYSQNFCVTATGIHSDVEINILPLSVARPGFDVIYKIIYKNKGNQIASGVVNMSYDDAVSDLVASNPFPGTQSDNVISWDFFDLLPFESRTIIVTLNLNSPIEVPSVNAGQILNYTAYLTLLQNDEFPIDNVNSVNQTVFNSFDPNDKICLEGNTIDPEIVGKYVHYMIRFENTGTFAAKNIVVKDLIDLSKFEIASLFPLDGSHDYYTRINGNKVEFIFENINLPFDDANNDGYVFFKIKTKPTLAVGDTFSNSASIYFDYNHPVVTDPAVTTVSVLGTDDFAMGDHFAVYPNPAFDRLYINAKDGLDMRRVEIYNTLGQLVRAVANPKHSVDVTGLDTGNYYLKIYSRQGVSTAKFLKK